MDENLTKSPNNVCLSTFLNTVVMNSSLKCLRKQHFILFKRAIMNEYNII